MKVEAFFESRFDTLPDVTFFVPGRVNLIGEHIDYNGGRVLPFALQSGVSVSLRMRHDDQVAVASDRFDGVSISRLGDAPAKDWATYAVFCIELIRQLGWIETGVEMAVTSNLSSGAGLSSSAALCVAILKAARELSGRVVSDVEIAQLARRVENDFVGVPCGIMDQMAVAMAAPGEALFLDTATLNFEAIPLPDDVSFVVLHSGIHRQLADGRYRERKEECDQAKAYFGTEDLCNLELLALDQATDLDPAIRCRVRHCITEHARTVQAAEAMRQGDMAAFGKLMVESHTSMRDDFEMSVPGVDALVDSGMTHGASGMRLTGGGFGGCVVACVGREHVGPWVNAVLADHPRAFLVQA